MQIGVDGGAETMTAPLLSARHDRTRTAPASRIVTLGIMAAILIGVVAGLVPHLVTHAARLLGAGDPVGRLGLGVAGAVGLLCAMGTVAAAGEGRGLASVVRAAVAFAAGFAAAALLLGPAIAGA